MPRQSKISKLPSAIREQINLRLNENEESAKILAWLNAIPEVRAVLKSDFDGAPIKQQNLSQWRNGGFVEWKIQADLFKTAGELSASAGPTSQPVDPVKLASNLATVLTARFAATVNAWDNEESSKINTSVRTLHTFSKALFAIKRTLGKQATRKASES